MSSTLKDCRLAQLPIKHGFKFPSKAFGMDASAVDPTYAAKTSLQKATFSHAE